MNLGTFPHRTCLPPHLPGRTPQRHHHYHRRAAPTTAPLALSPAATWHTAACAGTPTNIPTMVLQLNVFAQEAGCLLPEHATHSIQTSFCDTIPNLLFWVILQASTHAALVPPPHVGRLTPSLDYNTRPGPAIPTHYLPHHFPPFTLQPTRTFSSLQDSCCDSSLNVLLHLLVGRGLS